MRCIGLASCLLLICTATACSGNKSDRKETFPLTGELYVDGKPAHDVKISFEPIEGLDDSQPTITSALTDAEGKFSASTYEEADGAPVGEYLVTFVWGQLDMVNMTYGGDRFKGRYDDPKKSKVRATIVSGQPTDMGRIELKSK